MRNHNKLELFIISEKGFYITHSIIALLDKKNLNILKELILPIKQILIEQESKEANKNNTDLIENKMKLVSYQNISNNNIKKVALLLNEIEKQLIVLESAI